MGDRLGIHGAVDLLPPALTFQVHLTHNKGLRQYHLGQNCCVFRYFLLNFKQPVLGYLKSYQAEMSTTYRWCQNLLVVKFSERYNVTLCLFFIFLGPIFWLIPFVLWLFSASDSVVPFLTLISCTFSFYSLIFFFLSKSICPLPSFQWCYFRKISHLQRVIHEYISR